MPRDRGADYLPDEVVLRQDFADACAERDLGALFRIAMRYGVGFTPSHLARRCEMTVSKVQDYAHERTLAQSIVVFERVCDGLHIPGHMLGVGRRSWEDDRGLQRRAVLEDSEVSVPFAGRGLITRREWNDMIASAGQRIWLYGMAEFGYATDDDVPSLLADAAARGCVIHVLLLDPAFPGTVEIDACEGSPPGTLSARINAALARFGKMRCRCENMEIRTYSMHPSASVIRADGKMIVTPYLRYFTGSNSPTFEFREDHAPKTFDRYSRHFEETWKNSEEWR